jgi:multidrug resistance efflux pump
MDTPSLPRERAGRLVPLSVGLGVLLLGFSAVVAWTTVHSPAPSRADGPAPATTKAGAGYRKLDQRSVAVAYVDVEGGILKLYPVSQGRVVDMPVKEGQEVEKGEVLLRLDDQLAKIQLAEAKLALAVAEKRVAQAKELRDQQEKRIKMQDAAIAAMKSKLAAARAQADKAKRYKEERKGVTAEDVQIAERVADEADAGVKAELAKMALVRAMSPASTIDLAELDVEVKKQDVKKAELAVRECTLVAPVKGKLLRRLVNIGETLGASPRHPALEFCPSTDRIVRAEVEQEFAGKLAVGMKARIEDDATGGGEWHGKVLRISDWYTQRRAILFEPMQFNDVRTLEVIIQLDRDAKNPLRIGQRVRVMMEGGD